VAGVNDEAAMAVDGWRRHALGVLAIALLSGAAVFWFFPPEGNLQLVEAACLRMGPVAAIFWIAWRELSRLPPWLVFLVPVVAALLVLRVRWQYVLIAVPLVIVLWILKPRAGPGAKPREKSGNRLRR
jgi:hypothetical protein